MSGHHRADTLIAAHFSGPTVWRAYYGSREGYLRWLEKHRFLFHRQDMIFEAWTIDHGRTATSAD